MLALLHAAQQACKAAMGRVDMTLQVGDQGML